MPNEEYDLGMVGLGVMGSNLVLNMADHGFSIAGLDKDIQKVNHLQAETGSRNIFATTSLADFIQALRKPRAIMMLVPAGSIVDGVIRETIPYLETGDILIDGGNSYYKDTNLRQNTLAEKGLQFLGVGISGGEAGARHGASLMPGGPEEAYRRVEPILEAVAAKVNGEPCVAFMGQGSAGHYVKMVHNGLEYGLMELIAESYDLMKRGLGLMDEEIEGVFTTWNKSELNSFLIEITAKIFAKIDPQSGRKLIDVILDEARQKGTGKWTSQDAMDLQVAVPTIDMAVGMRDLSTYKKDRQAGSKQLPGPEGPLNNIEKAPFLNTLKNSLYASMIITFAQGMELLQEASKAYNYQLDLQSIASIWRGGCIIRAALLEPIRSAYQKQPDLANLLFDPILGSQEAGKRIPELRELIGKGIEAGIPVPAFMASLAYYDSMRSLWLPANLIQAQRDFFGAHTYERVDERGVFHTQWEEE